MAKAVGFRVYNLGFMLQGVGFRVWSQGLGV
jgi:hypothetical protein